MRNDPSVHGKIDGKVTVKVKVNSENIIYCRAVPLEYSPDVL
jgi:hypothetical protein